MPLPLEIRTNLPWDAYPELAKIFAPLSQKLDTKTITELNFQVDGEKKAESPLMRGNDPPYFFDVDVTGAQMLLLLLVFNNKPLFFLSTMRM